MRRVIATAFGPVEDLTVVEEPDPVPSDGEVVVEVEAAGVSFVDGLIVAGRYQLRPALPFTPGSALAGRVAAVGSGVTGMAPGDRVAGLSLEDFGGYASHVALPAETVTHRPDAVSAEVAATALESYGTVLFAVTHRVPVIAGAWVVVLGAGGGIGLAAVDVAHGLGARVIAVASSAEKRAAALAAGAEAAIDYGDLSTDLKNRLRELTGGGADLVLDPVGGAATEAALRALGPSGALGVIGFTTGEIPRLPANVVLLGNRAVIGVDWGDWGRRDPAAAARQAGDLLARIARGELHPTPPATHPLDEAGAVLARFEARTVTGKIALRP